MTMFMYILCEGLVEPKQTLFFSCCPSSHCQFLQYNQMKIEIHQYPAQNSDSTNLFDILAQWLPPKPGRGGPTGLQHQAARTDPGLEDGTFLVYDQLLKCQLVKQRAQTYQLCQKIVQIIWTWRLLRDRGCGALSALLDFTTWEGTQVPVQHYDNWNIIITLSWNGMPWLTSCWILALLCAL